MKPYVEYDDVLLPKLKDPKEAAAYLTACFEDGNLEVFLLALYDVARAHGMTSIAEKARLHRVSLHKMLSKNGNPELNSLVRILDASGIQLAFQPKAQKNTNR